MKRAWFRKARTGGGRWSFAAPFALAALLMQVLIPQGFMPSSDPARPGLVICTGHGPLDLADAASKHGAPAKAPGRMMDGPCGFAGHGAASAPPITPSLAMAMVFVARPLAVRLPSSLAPGLGLAAPPPPALGPPASPI
jgi:hypothetical protein